MPAFVLAVIALCVWVPVHVKLSPAFGLFPNGGSPGKCLLLAVFSAWLLMAVIAKEFGHRLLKRCSKAPSSGVCPACQGSSCNVCTAAAAAPLERKARESDSCDTTPPDIPPVTIVKGSGGRAQAAGADMQDAESSAASDAIQVPFASPSEATEYRRRREGEVAKTAYLV